MDEYYRAINALPAWLARPMMQLPDEIAGRIHEVRLRSGQAIYITMAGRQCALPMLAQCPPELRRLVLTQVQLEEIFYALCGGSVHAHQTELMAGYVTACGGCRVGVGGLYFEHPEQGVVLQMVRSLSIRIARQKTVKLPEQLCRALQGHFIGLLLIGEPDSGKTTVLREIAHMLAARGTAVAVIDERREMFPQKETGGGAVPAVDVISGLPKGKALQMALRTLSPKAIVFDELGSMDEVEVLEQGFFSGVDFVASLHASSVEDALCRPQVQYLKQHKMLRILVLLEGSCAPGVIREVRFA